MQFRVPFSKIEELVTNPEQSVTADVMKADLSMEELNCVHRWLWIVGSLGNISPLHHQKVLLREVIATESSRMHLVWFDRFIYIKPLPDYMLHFAHYDAIICKDRGDDLHSLVIGFLLTYMRLIQSPIDIAIAKELHLIPTTITWKAWALFRESIIKHTANDEVNKRYQFGELRLSRLNLIWRFTRRGLTYFTVHREYSTYFDQYFSLLITVFAFVAVILTAMQVIVGIEPIDDRLRNTCYQFSIMVLVGVCICFAYIGLVFALMFFYNLAVTRIVHARHND